MKGPLKNSRTITMKRHILKLLKQGEVLSELRYVYEFGGGTSFRTRISELRREGHNILDRLVISPSGTRYKEYWMPKETK